MSSSHWEALRYTDYINKLHATVFVNDLLMEILRSSATVSSHGDAGDNTITHGSSLISICQALCK